MVKPGPTPKSAILAGDGRYFMSTLAVSHEPSLLAVKSLVLNPKNIERGLAQINSVVTVLDGHTGLPVAVVDGNWVTAIRTARIERRGRPAYGKSRLESCRVHRLRGASPQPSASVRRVVSARRGPGFRAVEPRIGIYFVRTRKNAGLKRCLAHLARRRLRVRILS